MRDLAPRLALAAVLAVLVVGLEAPDIDAQEPVAPQQELRVPVDSIEIRGNERVPANRIIEESGLRVGMEVTYPNVQNAIRRLFATGEFSDVQIFVSEDRPAVFYIQVEERPFVARYDFEGLRAISQRKVRDTVGLRDGEPFSPAKISRTRAMLTDLLADEGLPRARVDTAMFHTERGYRLLFRIDEGPRLALTRISFEGNEAFSDDELRSAMSTSEEGFLWFRSGELRRDRFEEDLRDRLPDFYARHGYIDFAVTGDSIRVDPVTGKGEVVIVVDEGPQYRLSEFRVRGNRRFPSEELMRRFPQAELLDEVQDDGEALPAFDGVTFRSAVREIGDIYRDAGFLNAHVVPTVERLPPRAEGESPRVRATWHVEEGTPVHIRHVTIVGNDYTHDRIIRQRLQVLPGDVYSQSRLINSVQSVQQSGFFEALPPEEAVQISETPEGDVDITLRVKEQQTGNLNFGMSAAAGTGVAGFIGYEQPNLFGQAKSGRARLMFGGRSQDIELSYSDPDLFAPRHSGSITLRSSRDQFRTFGVGQRRQTGGSVEAGIPFPSVRATRIFVGYSLFRDQVSDLQLFGVREEDRGILTSGTRSTASLRLVRDTRAGGIFPTSGNRNVISSQISGARLGGDGDFAKVEFDSEWFAQVAQLGGGFESSPSRVTVGLSFEGGFIFGDNPFFRERFFMGGTNIGVELRGYEEATITPQGHVPRNARVSQLDRVGESYFATTGLLGMAVSNNLFVSTFVDAGNVWASSSAFNPTDLMVGAGFGVSLVTPFGPLGIDYAYGFDRRDVLGRPDPGWQLHFKFGQLF